MRIAGYVREVPGHQQADTAFAQSERIRRWVRDTGNDLIAVCEDTKASTFNDRSGYAALVEIVRSGGVDAVVVGTISALSDDKVLQEIMLVDLRAEGVTVVSTEEKDHAILDTSVEDHTRMVVRDVVAKVTEYRDAYGLGRDAAGSVEATDATGPQPSQDPANVVVELIAPTG
ncbi:MAG: recombinase family protein [Acidimicrobiia bacterium]